MKRISHYAAIMLLACNIACNNSNSGKTDQHSANNETPADQPEGLTLISNSDCGTCHNATTKVVGPAFKDIAAKYENTAENISRLADEVINGNSGVWSNIPMTSHAGMDKKEVEKMVSYILSLRGK